MTTSGIVRNLDPVGRVVIPIEVRKLLGICIGDPIEITVEDEKVVLTQVSRKCVFCGSNGKSVISIKGKAVCKKCRQEINGR